jgi:two-component system chemotaxis response regulator CheY
MQLKDASVLLVDDEPVLLDMLRECFEGIVGQVSCAGDGRQALEFLDARKVDLVITDIRMPVMDGITLLKRIKASKLYTPTLILITGFADIRVRDAYDLGAEALLEKPIEWDGMIDTARRSLSEPWERWERQEDISAPVLSRSFRSLASALEEHRIAFGRGGFCLGNTEFVEGPVNIALDFTADEYVLIGQGVVRWNEDNQIGVELTYVADESRERAVQLCKRATAFIPRTTTGSYQALAG